MLGGKRLMKAGFLGVQAAAGDRGLFLIATIQKSFTRLTNRV